MDDIDDFLFHHRSPFPARVPAHQLPSMRHTAPRGASLRTPGLYGGQFDLDDDDTAIPTVVRSLPFTPPSKTQKSSAFGADGASLSTGATAKLNMSPAEEITTEGSNADGKGAASGSVASYIRTPQSKSQQQQQAFTTRKAGETTPAVSKYFNLLREMQDSPVVSDEHPQNHIINRKFRLAVDGSGESCSIVRVLEDELRSDQDFSHQEDISALVNIGDAALCRLIASRTALSTERSSYRTLCEATTTLTSKISSGLTAYAPVPTSSAEATNAAPAGEAPVADDEQLWDASKQLLRLLEGQHEASINKVVVLAADCAVEERNSVMKVFELLLEECRVQPHTPPGERVTWERVQEDVDGYLRREHEAKVHGNLAYGASLRRSVIHALHDGLKEAYEQMQITDAHVDELKLKRRSTDALVSAAIENIEERLAKLELDDAAAQRRLMDCKKTLQGLEVQNTRRSTELMQFLSGNEAEVTDTVAQIEALYTKLESLVHTRTKRVKEYIQEHGSHVLRRSDIAEQHETTAASVAMGRSTLSAKKRFLETMKQLQQLREPLRLSVDAKVTALAAESVSEKNRLVDDCERLGAELRHYATSWVDVLMKNSAREAERALTLQSQIRDATERYDQQDQTMFKASLDECAVRKAEIQQEIREIEGLLSSATRLMHAAGIRCDESIDGGVSHNVSCASATRRPRTAESSHQHHGCFSTSPSTTPQRPGSSSRPSQAMAIVPLMERDDAPSCGESYLDPVDTQGAFTLVDVDSLAVEEFVPLFRKSMATTAKWIDALRDCDIETLGDLRDIKRTPVWESFMMSLPLLKTHLEMLLENPDRFLQ